MAYKVCADNWSDKLSNIMCSKLGLGDQMYWTAVNINKSDESFNSIRVNTSGKLIFETDNCKEGVVALACEELNCSSNLAQLTTPMFAVNTATKRKCSATVGK